MGWDDAPPDTDLNSSDWAAKPPDPDLMPGKSPGDFGMNVLKGVGRNINPVNIVGGLGSQLKTGLYDLPKQAISDSANAVQNVAGAITGRENLKMPHMPLQEMVTQHPLVKDPVNYAYKNPVDVAMLAATPFLAMGGAKGALPEATEMPKGAMPPEPAPMGPAPEMPGAAPKPPVGEPAAPGATPPGDPLKQVSDYIAGKYGKAEAKPGFYQNVAKYLQEESRNLGGKDIRLQPRQIQSMGPGFEGTEKAGLLVDFAREKGFLDPGLTDVARKAKIKALAAQSGQQTDAARAIADQRGTPPDQAIRDQLKTELTEKFGDDAPREIAKVLQKFDKAQKTFSGLADLATKLNKFKTPAKSLGQHPGPTTEGANIISRMNNDAMRQPGILNPQESALYTDALRNYGAAKKLEQAAAGAERSSMSARSNQRGPLGRIWQEALDRGGYRFGGNVANRLSKAMLDNPSKVNTLPQFFEELAHHANDELDETLGTGEGMAHGGIVKEMGAHLESKYGKK